MNAVTILKWSAAAELVTLTLMLANIVTVHEPVISSSLGPTHGLAYTATVIAGILAAGGRHRVWALSLIPGVGGYLAYRTTRSPAGKSTPAHPKNSEMKEDQ